MKNKIEITLIIYSLQDLNKLTFFFICISHILASAGSDGVVRVWNAWGQKQSCVRMFAHHTKAVRDIQWSKDGKRLLTASFDRTACIVDVTSGN